MKKLSLLLLITLNFTVLLSQNNTIARFKFEEAEQDFVSRNYTSSLTKLGEVEVLLGSTNPKIMYLQILCLSKLIEQDPWDSYSNLSKFRTLTTRYLNENESIEEVGEKYREVYELSKKFTEYPKTEEQFSKKKKEIKDQQIADEILKRKNEEARIKAETERKQLELAEKMEKAEAARLKEIRNVSFGAFRLGFTKATNDVSTKLSPYSTNPNSSFSTQFETGKFGLNSGFCAGFTGISALEFINKILHPRVGFGLYMDFNVSMLRYSWEKLATTSGTASFLYSEAKYNPFFVASTGAGLSFTCRPIGDHFFIDFYIHPDFYMTGGGAYRVDTNSPDGTSTFIETARDDVSIGIGKSLGFNLRYKNLLVGMNWHSGIEDHAVFNERYSIGEGFQKSYNSYNIKTPLLGGLNLSYRSINIGVVF